MIKQRSVFDTIYLLTILSFFLLVCLNYLTGFLGIWLPVYISTIFVLSVYASFRVLQRLLSLNTPINFDDAFLNSPWGFVRQWIPLERLYPKNPVKNDWKEYDTNELSIFSTVLEKRLVSSWYLEYVSQEIGFPFACKELLDYSIGKAFQIANRIDTPALYTDVCSILLSHLKEYKRAVKLQELSKEDTFQMHYRMMHPVFSNQDTNSKSKCTSAEHCANILRVVMKELIPLELWDTPHSELLVRILTKRLDSFIKDTLSNPDWLNTKLLNILQEKDEDVTSTDDIEAATEKAETAKATGTEKEQAPREMTIPECKKSELVTPISATIESALSDLTTKTTAAILQNAIADQTQAFHKTDSDTDTKLETINNFELEPIDIQASPILRQRRGRQGKSEVKIYDRIIEGSVKTWESDVDLRCISVGQDLLASLDGEISLSRLWESDHAEAGDNWSPNPPQNKSPPALWFGEEDTMDLDLDESPPKRTELPPAGFTCSGLQELSSTVNQAKHKFGDLQDEAAGMMEGILDFGIAGLKKGLRLTGLHEVQQDKATATPVRGRATSGRASPPDAPALASVGSGLARTHSSPVLISDDSEEMNDTGRANASLVKQHRVTSQDSVPLAIPGRSVAAAEVEAAGAEVQVAGAEVQAAGGGGGSPEPQYEEAADFASSIAKLRSLLQQRAADTPPRWQQQEAAWWDGAEETRGRALEPRHAHRPVDSATLADEYDVSAERSPAPESTNNMQRLDKLFQRTMTGVLNTIKTAVGGEGEEAAAAGGAGALTPPAGWHYVCTSHDLSVGGCVARLVATRRALAVDAAFDSLELATPPPPRPSATTAAAAPPLDLEEWMCGVGARWAGAAELAAAAGLCRSHVAHTLATALLAELAEKVIRAWLRELAAWLRRQVFLTFEQMAREDAAGGAGSGAESGAGGGGGARSPCDAIADRLPVMSWVFGDAAVRSAVQLCVESVSDERVNADLACRLLDVAALHFTRASPRNSTPGR